MIFFRYLDQNFECILFENTELIFFFTKINKLQYDNFIIVERAFKKKQPDQRPCISELIWNDPTGKLCL
jgi:hypothetical protein